LGLSWVGSGRRRCSDLSRPPRKSSPIPDRSRRHRPKNGFPPPPGQRDPPPPPPKNKERSLFSD
jgi:hypothetical protein